MAKKKIQLSKEIDRKIHTPVHALSRNAMLTEYSNFEIKRDIKNTMNYERVQDPLSSLYGGLDPRRRNEVADAGMVKEDRAAMANLSNEPIHQEYPRTGYYSNPYIQDSTKED